MTQRKRFTDEELVAYLDGEAEFAPMEEIDTELKTDTALAVRLASLRVDRGTIATSFSGLVGTGKPKPILPESTVPRKSYGFQSIAAAAVIALLVGFGAGFLTSDQNQQGWKDYVAAYQALYANSTLVHLNQSNDAKAAELRRVAAAIGKNINPNDVQISAFLDFKRAQILSYKGQALIQLAFLSSTGDPIALCIKRSEPGRSADVRSEILEKMSAAYWSKDGYDYLLIGGKDTALIRELASQYAASI